MCARAHHTRLIGGTRKRATSCDTRDRQTEHWLAIATSRARFARFARRLHNLMASAHRRVMTIQPAQIQPAVVDHERVKLARRWPAAVRDVLVIAAQVDRFNRRAGAAGLSPIVEPPVAIVAPLWEGLMGRW